MNNKLSFLNEKNVIDAANSLSEKGWKKNWREADYLACVEYKYYPIRDLVIETSDMNDGGIGVSNFIINKNFRTSFSEATGFKTCHKKDISTRGGYISFKDLIQAVSFLMVESNSELSDFRLCKVFEYHVRLKDKANIIANSNCHYEFILKRGRVFAEVHFEGEQKMKDIFQQQIKELPVGFEWIRWQKSKSIRVAEGVHLNNENAAQDICEQMLSIELQLGNKLRNIIVNKQDFGIVVLTT